MTTEGLTVEAQKSAITVLEDNCNRKISNLWKKDGEKGIIEKGSTSILRFTRKFSDYNENAAVWKLGQ